MLNLFFIANFLKQSHIIHGIVFPCVHAQINRDYENSSIPSSKAIRRKKITNSREKAGREPGGQPGHKGHGRKKQEPTQPVILLPPPKEVFEDCTFKKTARTITKQLVSIRMVLDVKEYHADVYYNSQTGERIHAAFPDGIIDDVNYDGSFRTRGSMAMILPFIIMERITRNALPMCCVT